MALAIVDDFMVNRLQKRQLAQKLLVGLVDLGHYVKSQLVIGRHSWYLELMVLAPN